MKISAVDMVINLVVAVLWRIVGSPFSPWFWSVLGVDGCGNRAFYVGTTTYVGTGTQYCPTCAQAQNFKLGGLA